LAGQKREREGRFSNGKRLKKSCVSNREGGGKKDRLAREKGKKSLLLIAAWEGNDTGKGRKRACGLTIKREKKGGQE